MTLTVNVDPSTAMIPTIATRSGMSSPLLDPKSGWVAKKLKSMNAVAFVGPSTVSRDEANSGATIAATAEHTMPCTMGNPAIAA